MEHMGKTKLYGQLLAKASLLPDTKRGLIFQRLDENKDFIFIKSPDFLAIGSEDRNKISDLNILNRNINLLSSDNLNFFIIIHKIVNP